MTYTDQHVGIDKRKPFISGDSKTLVVTVEEESDPDVLRDIAGTDITWVLAPRRGAAPIVTKDNGANGGVQITDPSNGVFTVDIDPDDTDSLEGLHYHEAQVVDNGEVGTVLTGDFKITADSITTS